MAEPATVDEPQTTQNGNSNNKKKRKHNDDTLAAAYTSVKAFEEIPATNRPGTPHRYFEASYAAKFADDIVSEQEHKLSQVIHCHANGLAIVTIGELSLQDKSIQGIEFCIDKSPTCNAAEKRKRQAKMLKGKTNIEGVVTPSTVIAKLTVSSDSSDTSKSQVIPVYAGVWGAVLELNKTVSVDTLQTDPLLDGYLAVILPSGPFPPPSLRPIKIQKE